MVFTANTSTLMAYGGHDLPRMVDGYTKSRACSLSQRMMAALVGNRGREHRAGTRAGVENIWCCTGYTGKIPADTFC